MAGSSLRLGTGTVKCSVTGSHCNRYIRRFQARVGEPSRTGRPGSCCLASSRMACESDTSRRPDHHTSVDESVTNVRSGFDVGNERGPVSLFPRTFCSMAATSGAIAPRPEGPFGFVPHPLAKDPLIRTGRARRDAASSCAIVAPRATSEDDLSTERPGGRVSSLAVAFVRNTFHTLLFSTGAEA